MNINDFKKAMMAFTDDLDDIDLERGRLVVQIRDEVIEATVTESEGDIFVAEHGTKERAFRWLIKRVARVPQLADRIVTHVLPESHFVTPAGRILDRLEDDVDDDERLVEDVPAEVMKLLSKKPAGTSTILYVTSDAGEGKTTVIDYMARQQAQEYLSKKTDWLLIPMRLGGRSFLTFDDVIVAELVNRFRFQFFYYDAFIELVRLGVLVPAFDGFEEVFVEGSPGEAVSSLGNFVRTLQSLGSAVIAVRKAHFEYQNFQDRARLLDATGDVDVTFARISLERWDRQRFLRYAQRRDLSNRCDVYESVRQRLGADHPLLTRAVLAKRLVDVAQTGDVNSLLQRLGTDVADYFYNFVNAIIEREVTEKWIDRSGSPYQPLLTIEEHHILLTMIAKEMWGTSSDMIDGDYMDLITELFAEEFGKSAPIARQIANRIGQHSLMTTNGTQRPTFSFDHDDFKMFYWGEALARMLMEGDTGEVQAYLGRRHLPEVSADAALAAMRRGNADMADALGSLANLALVGPSASYVAENTGALAIRLLAEVSDGEGLCLKDIYFRADSLRGRRLRNVTFVRCNFARSSLEQSEFSHVAFENCSFDQIELAGGPRVVGVRLEECTISCVVLKTGTHVYDPGEVLGELKGSGFELDGKEDARAVGTEPDERTMLAERALRTFLRASAVNESILVRRLGIKSGMFLKDVLPSMVEHGVLEEVEFKGGGQPQRRFKLGVSMLWVEKRLAEGGRHSLDEFLGGLVTD